MIFQFIASLGTQFATQWATGFNADNSTPVLVVIGCAIILFAVAEVVTDCSCASSGVPASQAGPP